MRLITALALALILSSCTGSAETTTTTIAAATTTDSGGEATTVERLADCPPPSYEISSFPPGISSSQTPVADLPFDDYTIVPGSSSQIWVADDGGLAMALVRGALPPEEWPAERGEVSIDGARGVAGPFEDGSWVVAWFEAPGERCDRYTLVFYPPVDPLDVQSTIESLNRTAG